MAAHLDHGKIPSCRDCVRWVYDPKTWRRTERRGLPVRRQKGQMLPCRNCPKAERGQPNPGADMRGKNWQTLLYYYRAQAGLPVPEDPLLYENITLIRGLMENLRNSQAESATVLAGLLLGGK